MLQESLNRHLSFFLILSFIFILNPFCGIILTVFCCFQNGEDCSKALVYLLFLFLAFWLGSINMTKVPASDMIYYVNWYNHIPDRSFFDNIFHWDQRAGKDPFYALVVYLGYYLTFGNAPFFVFCLTISFYMLIFNAIYKIYDLAETPLVMLLGATFILAFFPQVFGFSAHLIRQMLATSLLIYALGCRLETGKNNWCVLMMAVFAHTMIGLVALMSIIPMVYKRLSLIQLLCGIGIVSAVVVANSVVSGLFADSSISTLSYASYRFGRNGDMEGADNIVKYLVCVIFLVIYARIYVLLKDEPNHPVWGVFNIGLLLVAFILSFYANPFMQMRYSIVLYIVVPILIPFLFYRKNMMAYWFSLGLSICMVLYFFTKYNHMGFEFAEGSKILLNPFFMTLLQHHPY